MTPSANTVRLPAVAGTFYAAEGAALDAQVQHLLRDANRERRERAARASRLRSPAPAATCPKALVVPHAGYIYSGPVAAAAYVELAPHAALVSRIVLLGPAHRAPLEGAVAADARWLRTPLGDLEVDAAAASEVVAASAPVHAREHSLEVQLPFLQKVVPSARIVPLAVGRASPAYVARVLSSLWGGPETVIVVSSDLSHYLPYQVGRALDIRTARRIVDLEPSLSGDEACGAAAINGLLVVAREKGLRAELLDLRSSGDTAGAREEVVGYGAFAFREPPRPRSSANRA